VEFFKCGLWGRWTRWLPSAPRGCFAPLSCASCGQQIFRDGARPRGGANGLARAPSCVTFLTDRRELNLLRAHSATRVWPKSACLQVNEICHRLSLGGRRSLLLHRSRAGCSCACARVTSESCTNVCQSVDNNTAGTTHSTGARLLWHIEPVRVGVAEGVCLKAHRLRVCAWS
jgi:hypothetical protein